MRFGSYSIRSHGRRDVKLAPLEVDHAIAPLVAAADAARGDPPGVVAATLLGQALGQRLDRLALVEGRAVDQTSCRVPGVIGLYCFSAICDQLLRPRTTRRSGDLLERASRWLS